MPVNLHGRRRVGKSWLFRRFAHGKPALVLVARRTTTGAQLADFSRQLEPLVGVMPAVDDVADLLRVVFRAARKQKVLAVIDEFPWLLPTGDAAIEAALSSIQAVMEEERDSSKLKLILCGSPAAQMESLQAERNPLHGRLIPLHLRAVPYEEARLFLPSLDPLAAFERFAIAGGMPRYLHAIGRPEALRSVLTSQVLDRDAPLWDEGRTILEQELREPKTYFALLQALAGGAKESNEIVQRMRSERNVVSRYLGTLRDMGLVERRLPIGAPPESRSGHWHLTDPFFRFWFRFVFPFQDELENGLSASALYDGEVAAELDHHVSTEFEQWTRRWTRTTCGATATKVGAWWGPATAADRAAHGRTSEEIDIVGTARGRVTVVGEAKWQHHPLGVGVLRDLDAFKIPALAAAGMRLSSDHRTLLFSRSGYTDALVRAASQRTGVRLVDVPAALSGDADVDADVAG